MSAAFSVPPYALASTSFRFPALAALAARSAPGGQRETVVACLVLARLAAALGPPPVLAPDALRERAGAARAWLATHELPVGLGGRFAQAMSATGSGDGSAVAAELDALAEALGATLDAPSRMELARLTGGLRSAPATIY